MGPEERNWSHKLLKGEHACLRQGSLQPGRPKPATLGPSQGNLPQLQGNYISPERSGQCCTRTAGCSLWTSSAEEHPGHGEGPDGRENSSAPNSSWTVDRDLHALAEELARSPMLMPLDKGRHLHPLPMATTADQAGPDQLKLKYPSG